MREGNSKFLRKTEKLMTNTHPPRHSINPLFWSITWVSVAQSLNMIILFLLRTSLQNWKYFFWSHDKTMDTSMPSSEETRPINKLTISQTSLAAENQMYYPPKFFPVQPHWIRWKTSRNHPRPWPYTSWTLSTDWYYGFAWWFWACWLVPVWLAQIWS